MEYPERKIKTLDEIELISQQARNEGKKVVSTNGTYDILHEGHIRGFYEAKSLGDLLIVGINSDSSIREYKKDLFPPRPINNQDSRILMVAALEAVDYVSMFDDISCNNFVKRVSPHVHCKGGDYTRKTLQEWDLVESLGGKIHLLKFHEGYSTTNILKKIQNL